MLWSRDFLETFISGFLTRCLCKAKIHSKSLKIYLPNIRQKNYAHFTCNSEIYHRAFLGVEGSKADAKKLDGLVVVDSAEEGRDVGVVRVDLVVVVLSKV